MNVNQRHRDHRRRFSAAGIALAAVAACALPASAEDKVAMSAANALAAGICASSNAFAATLDLSGTITPCVLGARTLVLETTYVQNASQVGGTALAAYPLVRVRAGLVPRLEFTLDLPSAIAQSVPGGGGAFPVTHAGYGLTYALEQSAITATAIVAEVLPPDSRFAPAHAQARYVVALTSSRALTHTWTIGAQATGTSSARAGFGLIWPALAVSTAYRPSVRTQFVSGIGMRIFARHGVAQSFGDIGFNEVLNRKLVFSLGVGTTFNAVSDTKPHYLASGFTYRP